MSLYHLARALRYEADIVDSTDNSISLCYEYESAIRFFVRKLTECYGVIPTVTYDGNIATITVNDIAE